CSSVREKSTRLAPLWRPHSFRCHSEAVGRAPGAKRHVSKRSRPIPHSAAEESLCGEAVNYTLLVSHGWMRDARRADERVTRPRKKQIRRSIQKAVGRNKFARRGL